MIDSLTIIKNFKAIILIILTDKTKTKEKFSRIYKSETIITEILYFLTLVQPCLFVLQGMTLELSIIVLQKV